MRPVIHPERKAERDWFQLSAYRKRYLIDELHIHLLHYHEDKYIPLRHSLQDRFKKFCELME